MEWLNTNLHTILFFIQRSISFIGIIVILAGALQAIYLYLLILFKKPNQNNSSLTINSIRLILGRTIVLGLEFIVAADLIGTTTTPDYYAVGILASIVAIRTVLSFTLNRELIALSKET